MPLGQLRKNAANLLWFLDYDGSVCPHVETWEQRKYDTTAIVNLVQGLAKRSRGVFWNTGRRPESLRTLNPAYMELPGYFVHSATYWHPQKGEEKLGPLLPVGTEERVRAFMPAWPDFRLEVKPQALRVADNEGTQSARLSELEAALRPLAPPGWRWVQSHRGAELLAAGFDKRLAVEREMAQHKEAIPVVVGDDVLDRPAVEAALVADGYALLIGPHTTWRRDFDPAHIVHLASPYELLQLLAAL